MIKKITVKQFKSYLNATLTLAPLTLLVGANASGKSNLIEAIRFLSWLAKGRLVDDILEKVQLTNLAIRGTVDSLIYDGSQASSISLGCSLSNTDEWEDLNIEIALKNKKTLQIINESIRSHQTTVPLYEIKQTNNHVSHEVQVAYNNFARGGRKPSLACSNRQAIFTQLDIPSRFNAGPARERIPNIVTTFRDNLQQILFLDPNPRNMGGYSFIVDKQLQEDGANLSSVLYNLCEIDGKKEEVLTFIRALPEQDIADILFLKTPRNEVMLQLVESFAGHKQTRDAPILSDGTLRVLAVAAALLSVKTDSLLIIEEVDNGVHPNRANMLLQNIKTVAEKRNLHVLLTSHNPALLDTLPPQAIPDVVCCYRDPQQGDSRLIRLEDLQDYPELIAQGPLGQLMTKGVLNRFLKNQHSLEDKKLKGLAWLKSFKSNLELA